MSTITATSTASSSSTSTLHLRGGQRPTVNGKRMNETLHESCQWGCTPDGGMNRLALNDDDAKVRRWFIAECEKLGCKITIDSFGNIFAVYKGRIEGPPIAMGSHLDTQPTGGRYDGILGVLAGLEVLRAVHESGCVPHNPLAVVCWTDEEGSRFVPAMLGSGVWAEYYPLEWGHNVKDTDGVSVKEELTRHGFLGATPSSFQHIPLKAHFELHIEQGPILDMTESPVGTVSGVQALRWFEIKLQGRGSHAGTTPMQYRMDPLAAFGKFAVAIEQIANDFGGLCTIGRVSSDAPQSTNCILDNIVFHLDTRHHEDAKIEAMERACRDKLAEVVGEAKGVRVEKFERIANNAYVEFDPVAVGCVEDACREYPKHSIVSGAGHDSVHTAKHCPTAMVFIRCKDGVSHHPSEYSTPEDIAIGTKVLMDAVLAYDEKVAAGSAS